MDVDCAVVLEGDEGGDVAAFGEGDAAGVADEEMVLTLELPEVGVAVEEGVDAELGEVLRIVLVSVCQEETLAIVDEQRVIGHDGELEEHLIDLGVTVATHGDDFAGQGIETLDDAGSVHALGNAIAGTVVKNVAKDDEKVVMIGLEETEHLVETGETAVDIGEDEVAHGSKKV